MVRKPTTRQREKSGCSFVKHVEPSFLLIDSQLLLAKYQLLQVKFQVRRKTHLSEISTVDGYIWIGEIQVV